MFIDHLITLASLQQLRDIKEAIKGTTQEGKVKKVINDIMDYCSTLENV